jgi:hypothetical protein
VIIFLGDLMNEGSSSSDKEYEEFKARFDSIFPISLLNSVVSFRSFEISRIPGNKYFFVVVLGNICAWR